MVFLTISAAQLTTTGRLLLDAAIRPSCFILIAEIKNLVCKKLEETLNVKIGRLLAEEIDFEKGTRRDRLRHPSSNYLRKLRSEVMFLDFTCF